METVVVDVVEEEVEDSAVEVVVVEAMVVDFKMDVEVAVVEAAEGTKVVEVEAMVVVKVEVINKVADTVVVRVEVITSNIIVKVVVVMEDRVEVMANKAIPMGELHKLQLDNTEVVEDMVPLNLQQHLVTTQHQLVKDMVANQQQLLNLMGVKVVMDKHQ